MLNVREDNVNLMALGRHKPNTVLMDLETTDSLAAYQIGTNDQVVQSFAPAALHKLELLNLVHSRHCFIVALLFHVLNLLHALFDLLASLSEAIVCTSRLRLHCKSLHPKTIGGFHGRELHRIAASCVEVDPEEGPLALMRIRHALNRADMDGDPCCRRIWNQYGMTLHVDEDLSWL